jgi:hypothetical protein
MDKDILTLIELQALITEREGMVAENTYRSHVRGDIAYAEDSFLVLADKIRKLAPSVAQVV